MGIAPTTNVHMFWQEMHSLRCQYGEYSREIKGIVQDVVEERTRSLEAARGQLEAIARKVEKLREPCDRLDKEGGENFDPNIHSAIVRHLLQTLWKLHARIINVDKLCHPNQEGTYEELQKQIDLLKKVKVWFESSDRLEHRTEIQSVRDHYKLYLRTARLIFQDLVEGRASTDTAKVRLEELAEKVEKIRPHAEAIKKEWDCVAPFTNDPVVQHCYEVINNLYERERDIDFICQRISDYMQLFRDIQACANEHIDLGSHRSAEERSSEARSMKARSIECLKGNRLPSAGARPLLGYALEVFEKKKQQCENLPHQVLSEITEALKSPLRLNFDLPGMQEKFETLPSPVKRSVHASVREQANPKPEPWDRDYGQHHMWDDMSRLKKILNDLGKYGWSLPIK